jgi:hypothetical protein
MLRMVVVAEPGSKVTEIVLEELSRTVQVDAAIEVQPVQIERCEPVCALAFKTIVEPA